MTGAPNYHDWTEADWEVARQAVRRRRDEAFLRIPPEQRCGLLCRMCQWRGRCQKLDEVSA